MFSRAGTLRLLLALDAGALGSDCIALALTRLDDPVTAVPITRVALPSLEEATLEASYPAVAIVLCPAAGWRPEALYLDNGSTYTGEVLATLCSRLSIGLLHASPYDPQARGKMERFWRTLREGCLDHLGTPGSLHDVPVRLLVFLGKHYHVAPHASLMGKSPSEVYETAPRYDESIDDAALGAALTVRGRRLVRRDGTLEIGGTTFETRAGFLAGRIVVLGRTLLDPMADPWIEHEEQRYLLGRVNTEENARRKKVGPSPNCTRRGLDVPFDPPGALLNALVGRDGGER